MRTDYRYAVQLNRSTTLVSTAFAFAIVLKYKYNFCTLSLLTHVQLKESFTEFTVMLLFLMLLFSPLGLLSEVSNSFH